MEVIVTTLSAVVAFLLIRLVVLINTARESSGHVFPGASLPYGMAKAVADGDKEIQGGFASNDGDSMHSATVSTVKTFTDLNLVTGFSHMHDSGTGGVSISSSAHYPLC